MCLSQPPQHPDVPCAAPSLPRYGPCRLPRPDVFRAAPSSPMQTPRPPHSVPRCAPCSAPSPRCARRAMQSPPQPPPPALPPCPDVPCAPTPAAVRGGRARRCAGGGAWNGSASCYRWGAPRAADQWALEGRGRFLSGRRSLAGRSGARRPMAAPGRGREPMAGGGGCVPGRWANGKRRGGAGPGAGPANGRRGRGLARGSGGGGRVRGQSHVRSRRRGKCGPDPRTPPPPSGRAGALGLEGLPAACCPRGAGAGPGGRGRGAAQRRWAGAGGSPQRAAQQPAILAPSGLRAAGRGTDPDPRPSDRPPPPPLAAPGGSEARERPAAGAMNVFDRSVNLDALFKFSHM